VVYISFNDACLSSSKISNYQHFVETFLRTCAWLIKRNTFKFATSSIFCSLP
jgi:hypothetical protein